jgi:RNA polymerase sigma-70 factor (ECF subfamily)
MEQLYECYRRKVLKRAHQLLRDEAAAEDATQEVFLRLLDGNDHVVLQPEPFAWLYRVTTNLCLNRIRDENRRTKLLDRAGAPGAADNPDAEKRAVVAQLIGSVPRDLQEIAFHYHAEGMTCDEIAEQKGVSRRTIGNRLVTFQSLAAERVGNA